MLRGFSNFGNFISGVSRYYIVKILLAIRRVADPVLEMRLDPVFKIWSDSGSVLNVWSDQDPIRSKHHTVLRYQEC